VRGVAGQSGLQEQGGEQAPDFRDGQRDHPGLGGGRLIRAGWWWCLAVGAVFEQGGGGGADDQGGHDQHEVAGDGGVEADLGLIQAEVVLAELEFFLNRPPLMPVKRELSLA